MTDHEAKAKAIVEQHVRKVSHMGEPTDEDGATKSDQAYQVIASLATIANCFEHPEVIRALDYFASDRFDPEFLPFAVFEGKSDV